MVQDCVSVSYKEQKKSLLIAAVQQASRGF